MNFVEAMRHHVERSLCRDLGLSRVTEDVVGAYTVSVEGRDVVITPDPWCEHVRVSAVAAYGVKRTAALLRELNDVNCRRTYARLIWERDAVVATADVMVASIETGELGWVVAVVADCANRMGGPLAAVHGGQVPLPATSAQAGPGVVGRGEMS